METRHKSVLCCFQTCRCLVKLAKTTAKGTGFQSRFAAGHSPPNLSVPVRLRTCTHHPLAARMQTPSAVAIFDENPQTAGEKYHKFASPSYKGQCDNRNLKSNRRCNNIVSYHFIWIRTTFVTIFSWMYTIACCVVGLVGLVLGLASGLGLDLSCGW